MSKGHRLISKITLGKSLVQMVLLGRAESTLGPLVNLGFPAIQVGLKKTNCSAFLFLSKMSFNHKAAGYKQRASGL